MFLDGLLHWFPMSLNWFHCPRIVIPSDVRQEIINDVCDLSNSFILCKLTVQLRDRAKVQDRPSVLNTLPCVILALICGIQTCVGITGLQDRKEKNKYFSDPLLIRKLFLTRKTSASSLYKKILKLFISTYCDLFYFYGYIYICMFMVSMLLNDFY